LSLRGPSRARNATSGGQPGRVGCCRLYGLSCRAGEEKRSGEPPACDPGQPRSSKDWRWREFGTAGSRPLRRLGGCVRRRTANRLAVASNAHLPQPGACAGRADRRWDGRIQGEEGAPLHCLQRGLRAACIAGKPNKFGAATGLAERMGGHASICTAPATSHSSLARSLQTNEPSARRQVGREAR
jgi:hypothetical protein